MTFTKSIFFALLLSSVHLLAAQNHPPVCGTDHYLQEAAKANPGLKTEMDQFYATVAKAANRGAGQRAGVRIIPVVFHVLHQYGPENISKSQILDQMRILNEDFRRNNADKTKTRSIFAGVAADCEVEFRLATKDPQGNCTDGINRIYSSLTQDATDQTKFKAVSYWDSKMYLNIWVVKTIGDVGSGEGTVLGYAQFPFAGSGPASTDGVAVRADYVGSIGTAALNNNKGRVLTHEIGHWLGQLHTFQGGCVGTWPNEAVSDTPPVSSATYGCPGSRNSCNTDFPDLPDQTENYMDYADGACQNMFTAGQRAIMDNVFSAYRSKLISSANLTATGVADTANKPMCAPVADFTTDFEYVCTGGSIRYFDRSWRGTPTTYEWTFEGGTPATSAVANPTVAYQTAGLYATTLKVTNATGTHSLERKWLIEAYPATSGVKLPVSEGFETTGFPYVAWKLSPGSRKWTRTTATSFGGAACLYLDNYNHTEPGDTFSFITSHLDLMGVAQPTLEFYLSHALRDASNTDRLRVRISTDCGMSWKNVFNKSGSALANKGIQNASFKPGQAGDWRREIVKLNAYAGFHNVMFKFEFVSSGEGNNVYIDNINIGNFTLAAGQAGSETPALQLYPNPAAGHVTASFSLAKSGVVKVSVCDVAGKMAMQYLAEGLAAGSQSFTLPLGGLPAGVYVVTLETPDGQQRQKLIVE